MKFQPTRLIPNAVSRKAARALLHTQKNSPNLLFAAGVIGVGATVVLACKATLRIEDVLDDHEATLLKLEATLEQKPAQYTEKDYRHDKTLLFVKTSTKLVKLYAPAIVLGVASVAALTGAHRTLSKRNAALTASYAALEKSFKSYRERVVGEIGEEREREIRHQVETHEVTQTDTGKKTKVKQATQGGSMYARLFGPDTSMEWQSNPDYNLMKFRSVTNTMNDRLRANGHVFLNEVYDALGLERSTAGQIVGWVWDPDNKLDKGNYGGGDNWIDLGVFRDENRDSIYEFLIGREGAIWLDFNVDGPIHELLDQMTLKG